MPKKTKSAPPPSKTAATILMAFGQVKVSRLPLKQLKNIGLLPAWRAALTLRQCDAAHIAFSSEVGAGWREENASNKKLEPCSFALLARTKWACSDAEPFTAEKVEGKQWSPARRPVSRGGLR
jgi:hypothetical protein